MDGRFAYFHSFSLHLTAFYTTSKFNVKIFSLGNGKKSRIPPPAVLFSTHFYFCENTLNGNRDDDTVHGFAFKWHEKSFFFFKGGGDKSLLFFTFLLVFHLLICRQIEIVQSHQCGLFDKISPCVLKLLIIT